MILKLVCAILTFTYLCSHSVDIGDVENGNSGLRQMMDRLKGGSDFAGILPKVFSYVCG